MLPILIVLTLLSITSLLAYIHQLHSNFHKFAAITKLQEDELKRMQRWILNHRFLEPEASIVRLPDDKMISRISNEEEESRLGELFARELEILEHLYGDMDNDELGSDHMPFSYNAYKAARGSTSCLYLTQEQIIKNKQSTTSFQDFQASVEATFKAYHEETSQRIRRLEESVCSRQVSIRQEAVDYGHKAPQEYGSRFEYVTPNSHGPRHMIRETIPLIFIRPKYAPMSRIVSDHYEDYEPFDSDSILLQPILLSVKDAVIIHELGWGRKRSNKPHPGQVPTTGYSSDWNPFHDEDIVIGSNSGFAPGASGNPGSGGSDGSPSRPNTPPSTSPVPSSSGTSSSSSSEGSKKKSDAGSTGNKDLEKGKEKDNAGLSQVQ
ncbi:hypothetical protein M409DRAFT_23580 [Zasmidium cellare ATCC 36951]|uniref:Uncharacterized protein n=1 Tax=Zasmidium cellare ATCC 36951 TaxID=1080233 RepID=A0A6A6CH71_ZASCE|nr:uncharacterized protein M409DRAFT_23580 [Zasmidium cellare ATCC 36951]KAF2166391.1 hypothetical protein M409DRAFT_23580 [Zasmidium cellare ATCC 36951]